MYFSKFNDAANDLINAYNRNKDSEDDILRSHADLSARLSYCIVNGHRFYIPEDFSITKGKIVDPEMKFYMKLPFDCIVILSETHLDEIHKEKSDENSINSWKISIAIDIHGETNKRLMLFPIDKAKNGDHIIASVVFYPQENIWVFLYATSISYYPLDTDGFYEMEFTGNDYIDFMRKKATEDTGDKYYMAKEMQSDLSVVQNLCLMLGLNNVKTSHVIPDDKLNKKRIRNGKQPLYSYSVLNVDNILWDRHEKELSHRNFNGRRTHFRRGHIRRISSEKRVWVRAALVSGSIVGFADKEYHINKP